MKCTMNTKLNYTKDDVINLFSSESHNLLVLWSRIKKSGFENDVRDQLEDSKAFIDLVDELSIELDDFYLKNVGQDPHTLDFYFKNFDERSIQAP